MTLRRGVAGTAAAARTTLVAAALVGLLVAAGGGSCAVGTSQPGCTDDGECGGAFVCRGGACIAFTTPFDAGDDAGGGGGGGGGS